MMDYFTNKKFIIWTIIILVVMNLFSLSAFWLSMVIDKPIFPISKHEGFDKERRPEHFLEKELELSDEQKKQFEMSVMEQKNRTKEIAGEILLKKKLLFDELFKSEPDTAKIKKISEEIGMMQTGLEMVNNEHILELISICQPEQQEKLKMLFDEMLARSRQDKHKPLPPMPKPPPPQQPPPPIEGR